MTKAVFNDIHNRILRIQEDLGASAGLDLFGDRFKVGAIAAYTDLLSIEFEEVSNGD